MQSAQAFIMSKEFITNQDKLLAEVVNNYHKDSDNLYFLIGFFYFSGFEEIVDNLKDKNLNYLNSKLTTFFYQLIANEKGRILAQIKPELPGMISRENYEKAGIEELAEWEIKENS